MKIPTSMPMLDITTTNAVMEIKSNPVKLKITSEPAKMRTVQETPRFKGNFAQLQSEIGVKNLSGQRQMTKQRAYVKLNEGAQRVNGDAKAISDQLQNQTEESAPIVAQLEYNRVTTPEEVPVNVKSVPSQPLKLDWDNGDISIDWQPAKLEMSWEGDYRPEIRVTPHNVEIRLVDGRTYKVSESALPGSRGKIDTQI